MPALPSQFFSPGRILLVALFVVASFISGREAHAEGETLGEYASATVQRYASEASEEE